MRGAATLSLDCGDGAMRRERAGWARTRPFFYRVRHEVGERGRATKPKRSAHEVEARAVLAPVTLTVAEGRAKLKQRPPKPGAARQYARRWFANDLPNILETYGDAAIGGDVASLKALLTLCGFDRDDVAAGPARRRRGQSLAKKLLDDLRKAPPVMPAGVNAAVKSDGIEGGRPGPAGQGPTGARG